VGPLPFFFQSTRIPPKDWICLPCRVAVLSSFLITTCYGGGGAPHPPTPPRLNLKLKQYFHRLLMCSLPPLGPSRVTSCLPRAFPPPPIFALLGRASCIPWFLYLFFLLWRVEPPEQVETLFSSTHSPNRQPAGISVFVGNERSYFFLLTQAPLAFLPFQAVLFKEKMSSPRSIVMNFCLPSSPPRMRNFNLDFFFSALSGIQPFHLYRPMRWYLTTRPLL